MLGYGADPTVVMVRKNEEIDPKLVNMPTPFRVSISEPRANPHYSLERGDVLHIRVVFGPKIYYGLAVSGIYYWDATKLREWVKTHKGMKIELSDNDHMWRSKKKGHKLETYFEPKESPDDLRDFMITNRYAIVLEMETGDYRQERRCWMNPHGLKNLGFAKAIDPYTAYQELSMWVGGVLAGESPKMVKITDNKVLIENHGFDNVVSFRGPRIK